MRRRAALSGRRNTEIWESKSKLGWPGPSRFNGPVWIIEDAVDAHVSGRCPLRGLVIIYD